LDLIPAPIWLDPDGTYFGNVSGWTSIVPEGWESAIPTLLEAQTRAQTERAAAIARTLRHVPTSPLVVKNARLFDPASGETRPATTVVVSGDRIVAVGRDGEVKVPDGAEVIDAKGMAL